MLLTLAVVAQLLLLASCEVTPLQHTQCKEAVFDEQAAAGWKDFESDCYVIKR